MLLRIAGYCGYAFAAALLGIAGGTMTVHGMDEASAFVPPDAGSEAAAFATLKEEQRAAELAAAAPPALACADCSDRTGFSRASYRRWNDGDFYGPGAEDRTDEADRSDRSDDGWADDEWHDAGDDGN